MPEEKLFKNLEYLPFPKLEPNEPKVFLFHYLGEEVAHFLYKLFSCAVPTLTIYITTALSNHK